MKSALKDSRNTSRFFYGWVIMIASAIIYGFGSVPFFTFSLFIKPVAMEFGMMNNITSVTAAVMIYLICIALFSILAGILVDRIGPRMVNIFGGIVVGVGVFLCSRAASVGMIHMGFGVLVGGGYAFLFVPLQATISRWFVEKRGLALGVMFAGGGIGGMVFSPIMQSIINTQGWRSAYLILSILLLAFVIPSALLLKKDPSEMGLVPLGGDKMKTTETASAPADQDFGAKEAMGTLAFWLHTAIFSLAFFGIVLTQINLVPHATDKMGAGFAATAAVALGLTNGFNALGRLVMGAVSDKIGTRWSLSICMVLGASMIVWFIFLKSTWMIFAFAVLFGFAYGGIMPQGARLASELFGLKAMGSIMGVLTVVSTLGPALGPVAGAALRDKTGSFDLAFSLAAISIGIGLLLVFLIQKPQKKMASDPRRT